MQDAPQVANDLSLRSQVREAREVYFRISAELDELNFEVRSQSHGMVHPDGVQAIHNLAHQRRVAFERYQKAMSSLTADLLATKPSDRLPPRDTAAKLRAEARSSGPPQLTGRETEVLDRIAQGLTSKEIARELNISFKTAVTHRTHLMSKFDVGNVALLVRRAIASGHIKP